MHKKHHKTHHAHNPNHKNHADCIRTDRLNTGGAIVKKAIHRRAYKAPRKAHVNHNFYRAAQAVMNMSKVKKVNVVHNPKHKNHADCVRTDGLNSGGAIVRVVRKR